MSEPVTTFIIMSAIYAGTSIIAYQMRPKPPKEKGRVVNARSSSEILKLVYGKVLVGGNDVFIASQDNKLWIVQTLSEGECDSIATDVNGDIIFFSDNRIQVFSGYESHYFVSGSDDQNVETHLNAAVPGWTDTLRNVCYVVFKLTYNSKLYYGIPTRQVLLNGKKVYNLSTEITEYSSNPVWELLDYFTNPVYGLGKDLSEIDSDSWCEAAAYCEDQEFECNLAFDSRDTSKTIIDTILSYFRGTIISSGGIFYLLCADTTVEASVMNINDDYIVQNDNGIAQITISQPSMFDKVDGLIISYTDPELNYKPNEIIVGETFGVLEELDLTGVMSKDLAFKLGYYYLERRNLDRTIDVILRDNAVQLLTHDLVSFSSTSMGISDQLMRVIKSSIQSDGSVKVSLIYEDDSLYNAILDNKNSEIYNTTLPDPYADPSQVINIVFTEEQYNLKDKTYTRLKITWDKPSYYPFIDLVEVWISSDGITFTHKNTGTDGTFLEPVEIGETWWFKFVPINIWKHKLPMEFATIHGWTIVGKVAAPLSNVQNFNILVAGDTLHLSWNKVSDQDVIGYEIRYGLVWEQSIPLFIVDATSKTLIGMKPGSHTFLVKAKDAVGNYSNNEVSKTIFVIGPPSYSENSSTSYDFTLGTFSNTERYNDLSYGYVLRVLRETLEDHTAIYVDNNRMVYYGDDTKFLVNNQHIHINCGVDGILQCLIEESRLKYNFLIFSRLIDNPGITQEISGLTIGHDYIISFYINKLQGGTEVYTNLFGIEITDSIIAGWHYKSHLFSADSTSTTLTITSDGFDIGIAFIRLIDTTDDKNYVANGHLLFNADNWNAVNSSILNHFIITNPLASPKGPTITDVTIKESTITNNLIDYDIIDSLSIPTGYWESTVTNLGSIQALRWWVLYTIIFEDNSSFAWSNLFRGDITATWSDVLLNNNSWTLAFNANQVGDVDMIFYWSNNGVDWESATFFEILSMEVLAQYIKFRITLTDYSIDRRIMIEEGLLLKSSYWNLIS